jgi:predicted DNA-binding WGR domain protein
MTDSNFALDAGQSRVEDSAWRMSPKATLPRCILFSNASTLPGTSRAITFSIEPTLFAKHTLIRRWGRIGSLGRERLQFSGGEDASQAQVTLETWLARKRKRGYAPRSEPARPTQLFHERASS